MNIKAIRKKLEMTQEQFARGLGMSSMSVKRWESGAFQPSPLARKAIEIVYGIKLK